MSTKTETGRPSAAEHFTYTHPLAQVARDRCVSLHLHVPRRRDVTACGDCWEHAIRTDAVFAAESGLPPLPVADPDLVDDVAVERACTGEHVRLTVAEVTAAAVRLRAGGLTFEQIGERLHCSAKQVARLLRSPAPAAGAVVGGEAA